MIDTAKLKEKILDLAIRGKLVPQDPNDEPASVLLEKIRAEKLQMVKDGKLKQKDIKDDTVIFVGDDNLHYEKFADGSVKCIEDEIPFEIPKSWAWCRLATVLNVGSSKRVLQSDWEKEGIPFYRAREIVKLANFGFVNNDLFISENHYNELKINYGIPKAGDLMVTGVGTIGKVYIVKKDDKFYYKDASVLCFANNYHVINSDFAKFLLESSFLQKQIHGQTYGNTVDTITISTASNYLFLLPPLKEQKIIVEKIKEYNVLLNKLTEDKKDLLKSIDLLKSKILDLAIRGKLVPQDPNDEPADVLLKRIRKEKEELIKQGKIKRDKKESIIFKGDDNSYYGNLPNNWSLTTLKEITNDKELNDGDWIVSDNMVDSGPVKLIQLGSIGFMNYIEKGFKYLTHDTFERLNCSTIKENYLLINRIISDKMCCCMLPKINGTLITTVDTCWIAPNDNHYNIKYLMFALSSPLFQSEVNYKSSGTTRRRISKFNIINIQFPFPPILEQKKIVDDVEKLFKFIDNIASALK